MSSAAIWVLFLLSLCLASRMPDFPSDLLTGLLTEGSLSGFFGGSAKEHSWFFRIRAANVLCGHSSIHGLIPVSAALSDVLHWCCFLPCIHHSYRKRIGVRVHSEPAMMRRMISDPCWLFTGSVPISYWIDETRVLSYLSMLRCDLCGWPWCTLVHWLCHDQR